MCEREREPRRYKLKLQEFLWPCISVRVGLGFLTNILYSKEGEQNWCSQSLYFKSSSTELHNKAVNCFKETDLWKCVTIKSLDPPP